MPTLSSPTPLVLQGGSRLPHHRGQARTCISQADLCVLAPTHCTPLRVFPGVALFVLMESSPSPPPDASLLGTEGAVGKFLGTQAGGLVPPVSLLTLLTHCVSRAWGPEAPEPVSPDVNEGRGISHIVHLKT